MTENIWDEFYESLSKGKEKERKDVVIVPLDVARAYNHMYLLPTASWSLVRVVFRCLSHLYHPDKGGKEHEFIKLKESFDRIKNWVNQ